MENKQTISKNSIGKATVWSFAAELSAKIIVPVTNMVLARILAPEAFGIIATINTVVSFADMLSQAGFKKYIIQHEYQDKQSLYKGANVAFLTDFSLAMFMWFLILIFSRPIAGSVGCKGCETGLIVSALSLPLTGLSSVQEALFQRELNYKVLFYRRLIVSFLPFFVTIPLALLGLDYWSIIIGTLTGNIVKIIILSIQCEWKPNLFYRLFIFKEMFSFSMWTLFETMALWASSYIDILIISNKLGSYYTGLYKNSQVTVTGLLTVITGATTSVLFASLSRCQNNNEEFNDIFFKFQKFVGLFVIPFGVIIYIFSDLITLILLGKKWMEASDFIGIWGLCTSLVCVFGTFSREVYRAKGEPKISLTIQLLHLLFVIPVCLYGVSKGFHTLIYVRSFAFLQIIIVHLLFIKFRFRIPVIKMFLEVKEPIAVSVFIGLLCNVIYKYFDKNIFSQIILLLIFIVLYLILISVFKEYRKIYYNLINKLFKKGNKK